MTGGGQKDKPFGWWTALIKLITEVGQSEESSLRLREHSTEASLAKGLTYAAGLTQVGVGLLRKLGKAKTAKVHANMIPEKNF